MSNAALTIPSAPFAWRTSDWQRLWLSTQSVSKSWRSLALVPASAGSTPEDLLQIAVALARTGMEHVGTPIHVADATRITLAQVRPFTDHLESYVRGGETVILALSALNDNVTSLPLAKSADSALLCIVMGEMSMHEAKRTIAQVGAARFIGSALFRPPGR